MFRRNSYSKKTQPRRKFTDGVRGICRKPWLSWTRQLQLDFCSSMYMVRASKNVQTKNQSWGSLTHSPHTAKKGCIKKTQILYSEKTLSKTASFFTLLFWKNDIIFWPIFFKSLFKVIDTSNFHPELKNQKSVQPFSHNRNLKFLLSKNEVVGMTSLKTLYIHRDFVIFCETFRI